MKRFLASLLAIVSVLLSSAALGQYCPDGSCQQQGSDFYREAQPSRRTVQLPEHVRQAIVRVMNQHGNTRTFGTGTLIEKDGQRGIVISCAHLFSQGEGVLTVYFPGGQQFSARLLGSDPSLDLSALEIASPDAQPIIIAADYARRGEPVTAAGYGSRGVFAAATGQALGYVQREGGSPSATLEITGAAQEGDSGGPMLDGNYQLCGVLFGTNGRVIDGTCCPHIRTFLDRIRARLHPNRQAAPQRQPQQAGPQPYTPPLVELPPQQPPGPGVPRPSTPDLSLLDKIKADFAAERAKLQADLQAKEGVVGGLQSRVNDLLGKIDGLEKIKEAIPDITTPGNPFEQIAEKAGSAWLTTALVGLGLPAGPAGMAAGLIGSLVLGGAGAFLHSKFGKKPTVPPAIVSVSAELPQPIPGRPISLEDPKPLAEVRSDIPDRSFWQTLQQQLADVNARIGQLQGSASHITVSGPAPSTQIDQSTQFVPIDRLDNTWPQAHAVLAGMYPGMANTFRMIQEVRKQLLAGKKFNQATNILE